ncbi:unnamed protein product [Ilex paraguariensis]|uniref:Uncharacterized protein n=1 Tax=Ilex paraguariensis TaxID=185542 RepID=A0ABC8S9J9_9AQUA
MDELFGDIRGVKVPVSSAEVSAFVAVKVSVFPAEVLTSMALSTYANISIPPEPPELPEAHTESTLATIPEILELLELPEIPDSTAGT